MHNFVWCGFDAKYYGRIQNLCTDYPSAHSSINVYQVYQTIDNPSIEIIPPVAAWLWLMIVWLKGKFSSGIEGALAFNIKSRFQPETTIRNDYLHSFVMFSKVYLSNIDSETADIFLKRRLWILGVSAAL